jgi:ABC-type uncharacterized transport system substrate-binding protein
LERALCRKPKLSRSKIAQDGADAVMRVTGPMLFNERARVGAAVLAHRLPGMCVIAEEVPYGYLMSYGQDFPDFFRRAVAYTDKILKGAKPADLPVEQPTKFKLVLNLKTANAVGVGFPQSLILSADEMIGGRDHRFPPPWSVEQQEACFIVRDANGGAAGLCLFRG